MKAGTESVTARSAAVGVLNAVLGEGMMLSQVALPDGLSGPDRARAERLAAQVLRQMDRIDRVLKPLLRKVPPLAVLNILRLAVWERADGAAAHGVVNEAVALARRGKRTTHLSGLVNAVLRALPELVDLAALPAPQLPRWIRQPLVHAYGREVVSAIEAVQAQVPPVDITPKAGATALPEGELLPTGSIRLASGGQITQLPGYASGDWWVQDAAAAMAVRLMGVQKGEAVLDICAAPGGKTLQLADTGAVVTALDISSPRMARVAENLARTGLSAALVVADALHWAPEDKFDAVLLDAPCSATGTLRRHPDLPFIKDGSEVEGLVALQAALIDRALGWLKPGGRLVYCTCSLLPAEGENQLAAALLRHPGLRVQRPALPWVQAEWITEQGAVRLRPDLWAERGGMDGFFIATLIAP
ncbi:MAG: transcription antitermination factor NusB [Pseudotabrizicola sp.]|uniref:RsmB/NOP family class I SAM-dependent RNA methyltransferase n=1 Tax=Pseudotabrizicola sp. TaxID=2939647 RepID=UPI002722964B|nr:transcription antitermination factor NusB [Pseudotabrizicola sp.]MDO8883167.1 transcription antitermination factor NusB [Pseudotabrizicola sp.]MDP2082419.1 transcription antitermination factor NusB [Pseudotabrizicola sp.]MDZ7574172.1 transcription antitermination factor NusB [Pseudotabrizicola sp.]